MSKPGPGSRPALGAPVEVRTVDIKLIADKLNESLIDPPVYTFGGGRRNFQDYPPGTGIYAPIDEQTP